MGIRITTDEYGTRVWRDDKHGYTNYSITIQKKMESGSYVSIYKQVKFRKGVEVANGEEICIYDAFPTVETWKDRVTGEFKKKEVWMILDFGYKQKPQPQQTSRQEQKIPATQQSMFEDLPDTFSAAEDEIPF